MLPANAIGPVHHVEALSPQANVQYLACRAPLRRGADILQAKEPLSLRTGPGTGCRVPSGRGVVAVGVRVLLGIGVRGLRGAGSGRGKHVNRDLAHFELHTLCPETGLRVP
jgi:hypothetical protein